MHVGSFWIDPGIQSDRNELKCLVLKVCPGAVETSSEGGEKTLHVSTIDYVLQKYNSKLLFVSEECLREIEMKKIAPESFMRNGHQYISTCLVDMNITSTGFEMDEIRVLLKEIGTLGGNFERYLNDRTSVLMAATTACHKVYSAAEQSIQVVTSAWVHACFDSRIRVPFTEYLIPPFLGCKCSSTDLTLKQRKDLSKLVKAGGGTWSDSYDESVTYLIAHKLTSSRKILLALAANVPIVTPEWVVRTSKTLISPTKYTLNWWCFEKDRESFFRGISFELSSKTAREKSLPEAICECGGRISSPAQYCVALDLADCALSGIKVSPRWVWRCISEKRLIPIEESLTYKPFPFKTPLKGLLGKAISVIGFADDARLEIADALRNMGCTVYYSFSRNASIVLMHRPDSKTIANATEYGIPIVDSNWFTTVLKTGEIPDPAAFAITPSQDNTNLESICKNLKRTSSKQKDLEDDDSNKIDVVQLNAFTQMSPGSDRASTMNDIGYDTTDITVHVEPPNDGHDPLLSAFGE